LARRHDAPYPKLGEGGRFHVIVTCSGVNGRICFEFRDGDAFNVEIVDYHKG